MTLFRKLSKQNIHTVGFFLAMGLYTFDNCCVKCCDALFALCLPCNRPELQASLYCTNFKPYPKSQYLKSKQTLMPLPLQESTIISFSKSWSTVILKTVSTWLSVLVYLAMLVTPAWRKQTRSAGQTGSGQIPAGKEFNTLQS